MKKTKAGFTIIELLVVVSIIGVLSSVILVAVQGARQKGQTGAGLEFAAANYHAYGADAIGYWNFNEGGTVSALDQTINGRNFLAPVPRDATHTPTGQGYSLVVNSGVQSWQQYLLSGSGLSVPGSSSGDTVSVWVNVTSIGSAGGGDAVIVDTNDTNTFDSPLAVYIHTDGTFHCYAGILNHADLALSALTPGVWYNVTCSANTSTKKLVGYVNGRQVGSLVASSATPKTINEINVGGDDGNGAMNSDVNFTGYIDDVAIYSQPLN